MASTSCSICIKKKKTSDPVVYCPQCSDLMCQSCSEIHDRAEETKKHEVMPYQDYQKLPPFILKTNMNCSKHQFKHEEYCRMHDELACQECKRRFHRRCEDVLKLEDIVYNVKDSVLFTDTFSEIEDLCRTLKKAYEDRTKNIKQLKSCHKKIEKTIENKFDNIIEHLKKMKYRTISELISVYTELTNDLSNTSEIIHSEEEKLTEIIHQKESITKHASNYQTFVALKKMEKMVQETNAKLNELADNDKLKQVYLKIEMNETIDDIGIQSLGDIRVIKSSSTAKIHPTRPKDLEAQKEVHVPILAPVKLHFQQNNQLGNGYYNGCCTLPSGLVVLTDYYYNVGFCDLRYNGKVLIHKCNGSLRSTITFEKSEGIYGVTPVDEHLIAVSHPWSGTISIIDVNKGFINKGKVVRTLNIERGVGGLCCMGRDLVCCVEGKGLIRVNIDSQKFELVVKDKSVSNRSNVEVSSSLKCYTCPLTHTVIILDIHFKVIFSYKDETVLDCPIGVAIDDQSNIYVTGFWSDSLVVLSRDGKSCHQLLGKDDGLNSPTAVYYDSSTKKLVVVNQNGPVFLYSVE